MMKRQISLNDVLQFPVFDMDVISVNQKKIRSNSWPKLRPIITNPTPRNILSFPSPKISELTQSESQFDFKQKLQLELLKQKYAYENET